MGSSSHRIEILLVGAVMLLGGALALLAQQPQPHAGHPASTQGTSLAAALGAWLERASDSLPNPGDTAVLIERASQNYPALLARLETMRWETLGWTSALLCAALVGARLRRPLARFRSRLAGHLRPLWPRAVPLRGSISLAVPLRHRLTTRPHRNQPALDIPPVTPFLLDLADVPVPTPEDTDLLLEDPILVPPPASEPAETPSGSLVRQETGWTPQDLAHAAVAALSGEWREADLRSHVVAIDVEPVTAGGRVRALVDSSPAEERQLLALPERLGRRFPGWSVAWRRGVLSLSISGDAAPPDTGTLIAPVLRHGRGGQVERYLPLQWSPPGAPSSHLGLYGSAALPALHACLVSLLYAHPPSAFALSMLGAAQLAALYAGAPHFLRPPGSAHATLAALDRALRRGWQKGSVRPLVLVVLEPDDALLGVLRGLVQRLRQRPDTPLHLLCVQERPRAAGRELYALLPALVTAGGHGDPRLLPGCTAWPRRGGARFVTNGAALDGQPYQLEDSAAREMIAALGPGAGSYPPVIWDAPLMTAAVTAPWAPPQAEGETSPLALRLGRALDGEQEEAHPPTPVALPPETAPSRWPHGPGGLAADEVGALVVRLLDDPSIVQASPPGVTRGRLATLLPPERRGAATSLMSWLDASGVLADPRDETLRWREPRPIRRPEPDWIAARLSETPPPRQTGVTG